MLHFRTHIKHDNGKVFLDVVSTSKHNAILSVMKSEKCPITAVRNTNLMTSLMTPKECNLYYLDYVNNFLTVDYFAEHYGLTLIEANRLIRKGNLDRLKNKDQ